MNIDRLAVELINLLGSPDYYKDTKQDCSLDFKFDRHFQME